MSITAVSPNRNQGIGKVWFGHTLATIQKVTEHFTLGKPAPHKTRHARLAVVMGYVVYGAHESYLRAFQGVS